MAKKTKKVVKAPKGKVKGPKTMDLVNAPTNVKEIKGVVMTPFGNPSKLWVQFMATPQEKHDCKAYCWEKNIPKLGDLARDLILKEVNAWKEKRKK